MQIKCQNKINNIFFTVKLPIKNKIKTTNCYLMFKLYQHLDL